MISFIKQNPEDTQGRRRHPLAVTSLVLAIAGAPLFGLFTGALAAILAGTAMAQIAENPRLRGMKIALFAMVLGVADMLLWIVVLGMLIPRPGLPEGMALKQSVYPSFRAPEGAPPQIRGAMEANVLLLVEKPTGLPGLGAESYSGAGVIVARGQGEHECLALTNRHLVDPGFTPARPATEVASALITVYFHDGSRKPALVNWVDPEGGDLALVSTSPKPGDLAIPLTVPSQEIKVGDKIFAVGNPHGLSWSYVEGVVSGFRVLEQGGTRLNVIQAQVPINEGNSGGGLYSLEGELLGIVSWTKSKALAEGISFAIRYDDFLARYGRDRGGLVQRDGPAGDRSPRTTD